MKMVENILGNCMETEAMTVAGINRKVLLGLAAAFLFGGVIRLLTYGRPFAVDFSQLYFEGIVLIWTGTILRRVTDRRLRNTLAVVAGGLLVYLLLQNCRYSIFVHSIDVSRYLWYFYYTPMAAFPVILLAIALLIHRPENRPLPRWFWAVAALAALVAICILTNDLHFQFYSFPGSVMIDDGTAVSGWLLYAFYISCFVLYFIDYVIYLYKSRAASGKLRLLPLVPLLLAIVYFLLYPLAIGKRIWGFRLWNIGEMLVICLIGGLEICIQTGMIPANHAYQRLFALTGIPAAILDDEDNLHYTTTGTVYPFPDRESLQIMSHPISGGRIEWAADVRRLRQLNRELTDATRRIETRNAYLTEEAGIRAEQAETQARNEIYDRITQVTSSQAARIIALLDADEPGFDERLPRIAALSAYIKRRSNMELIAEDGLLPFEELCLAVGESMQYVRLCGVTSAHIAQGSGSYPARVITDAYEQIELLLETCLDSLQDLMIGLEAADDTLTVRIMLRADDVSVSAEGAPLDAPGYLRRVCVTKNEQDMILLFSYTKGGETL